MLGATLDLDQSALDAITGMLDEYAVQYPNRVATMTRKAGLAICDSLRARTKKAPKRARSSEYSAAPSSVEPRYITYRPQAKKWGRPGRRLPFDIHRWHFVRRTGTPDEKAMEVFVYARLRHTKRGKIVPDLSAEKAELLRQKGQNFHAGLAKASWGWTKKQIFAGVAVDASWKRRKNDRRDPTAFVDGSFTQTRIGGKSSAVVSISNRLDYIADALQPGAVNDAIEAARKNIAYKIEQDASRI